MFDIEDVFLASAGGQDVLSSRYGDLSLMRWAVIYEVYCPTGADSVSRNCFSVTQYRTRFIRCAFII